MFFLQLTFICYHLNRYIMRANSPYFYLHVQNSLSNEITSDTPLYGSNPYKEVGVVYTS